MPDPTLTSPPSDLLSAILTISKIVGAGVGAGGGVIIFREIIHRMWRTPGETLAADVELRESLLANAARLQDRLDTEAARCAERIRLMEERYQAECLMLERRAIDRASEAHKYRNQSMRLRYILSSRYNHQFTDEELA